MKRWSFPLLLLSLLLFTTRCYVAGQGARFLRLNSSAEEIGQVLEREELPADVRGMLSLTREIKKFSVRSIGLEDNKNYTRYVEIDRKYLVDVVSACEPLRFEPYQWKYPFLGKLPYRGYFRREDAEREARKLRNKGYEVLMREVDAFSTLGFFHDPVYTFMRDYSVYQLASVIIHEQAHATIFLRNQAQFNEELATFVGDEGALRFIREKYAQDSELYRIVLLYRQDLDRFLGMMRDLYGELDALYRGSFDDEYKAKRKAEVIGLFRDGYADNYDLNFSTGSFRNIEKVELNNAYLMAIATYTSDLALFYELQASFDHDLSRTVEYLKGLKRERGNPKEAIRERLSSGWVDGS